MMGLGMGFGLFGGLFMLLFWGGLIAAAVWVGRALFNNGSNFPASTSGPAGPARPSARDILDQRYARGEISREEYEQMKRDLQ